MIGGGTAGPMAALKTKKKNPKANVGLLDKANVKRSGAISMGMDWLNNSVIPGYATPEQYTKELTIANDGICDQAAVYRYASECYVIITELDEFGIRFQKDQNGEYDVKKVHHIGTYVLPMPNGNTAKKALYQQLRKARINIVNRYMATRLLTGEGRIAGAVCVNTLTAEFLVVRAKAVIMALGAAGRLGLPTSGYLSGTCFCSGHSASGVFVDEHARTTIPGLYAAGDMANVPHNYMLGAFTNGAFAGLDVADFIADVDFASFEDADVEAERIRVLAPTQREDGIPPDQIEYKTRRLVNDYLQPPKVTAKMELAQRRFAEVREDMERRVRRRGLSAPMNGARFATACRPMLAFRILPSRTRFISGTR